MPLLRFLAKPKAQTHVSKYPSSPLFIVANHVTSYDVPFVLHALPGHVRRRAAVAMSGEMILDWRRARKQGHWFLNLVAPIEYILVTGLFNVFPLPQFSGFRRSFQHAGEAIDHGYSVIVFPEGRRSDDGTPQPFMKGAGLLWKELGTPALAVRIEGLGEIKAGHSRWFRTGTITTTVRQLLPPERAKSPEELTRMLEDAVFGD
jgi:long-chain acyl-CoA synthetase